MSEGCHFRRDVAVGLESVARGHDDDAFAQRRQLIDRHLDGGRTVVRAAVPAITQVDDCRLALGRRVVADVRQRVDDMRGKRRRIHGDHHLGQLHEHDVRVRRDALMPEQRPPMAGGDVHHAPAVGREIAGFPDRVSEVIVDGALVDASRLDGMHRKVERGVDRARGDFPAIADIAPAACLLLRRTLAGLVPQAHHARPVLRMAPAASIANEVVMGERAPVVDDADDDALAGQLARPVRRRRVLAVDRYSDACRDSRLTSHRDVEAGQVLGGQRQSAHALLSQQFVQAHGQPLAIVAQDRRRAAFDDHQARIERVDEQPAGHPAQLRTLAVELTVSGIRYHDAERLEFTPDIDGSPAKPAQVGELEYERKRLRARVGRRLAVVDDDSRPPRELAVVAAGDLRQHQAQVGIHARQVFGIHAAWPAGRLVRAGTVGIGRRRGFGTLVHAIPPAAAGGTKGDASNRIAK